MMKAAKKAENNKVVLAYSGGLDTSVILKWLQDTYNCEVVTFTADLGQGEELEPARAKALQMGIKPKNIFIDDLREEFVRDFVFPMFRCNTVYEGEYLLGTSIARPLIAKRLVEIAKKTGANSISHGATGKGNDQVRFELGAYALMPNVKVIAPWREWDLLSREKLMAYAEKNGIPVEMKHKKGGSPYSMDANLLHISYEGRHLEDPAAEAEESMWRWTVSPEKAPDKVEYIDIEFRLGDPVSINGKKMKPHVLLATLNQLGGKHGIGRLDLVENRYVGMKSRGCYETPGGSILLKAHRAIESVCLDREVAHLKDDLMPRYASLIYNGYWWSPERKTLQALIDHTQQTVNGWVRLKLYKGNVIVVGRDSKTDSLFDPTIATFEDDAGAYNQKDAHGFIRLNALRMRIAANRAESRSGKKKG
jgi:argininosuccinate synthase